MHSLYTAVKTLLDVFYKKIYFLRNNVFARSGHHCFYLHLKDVLHLQGFFLRETQGFYSTC